MTHHTVTVIKPPVLTITVLGGLFMFAHPLIVVVVALILVGAYLVRLESRRLSAIRRDHDALAARADAQHTAWLAGHPSGTFGQYPPPGPVWIDPTGRAHFCP